MAQRGRWIRIAILLAIAALIGGRWAAVANVDSLWAEAVGGAATHALIRRLQMLLATFAFTTAAVWCVGNLYLVYRSIGSVHVPRRLGNLEILEAVPRRFLLAGAVAIGLILAVALSYGASSWWQVRALAGVTVPPTIADPVLDRDATYYLLRLPWDRTLHRFAAKLTGVMLLVITLLYVAMGAIRRVRREVKITDLARSHLAGLLAAFALALFWGYRLEPAEYVASVHGVPVDVVLTRVRLPVARLLSALAIVACAASLLWIWLPRAFLVVVGWGSLAGASFVGHYVAPGFAAAVRSPAERRLPGLEEQVLRFAGLAYGLPARSEGPPSANRDQVGRLLATGPLWDAFAVDVLLDRVAQDSLPIRLTPASLSLYRTAGGEPIPLFVAARTVDLTALQGREAAVTWHEAHVGRLVHGRGAVAVAAGSVTASRLPEFVPEPLRPEDRTATVTDVRLADPVVRFAPGLVNYAVVQASDDVVGIAAGGLTRRFALAWVLQSRQLLTSPTVWESSRIVRERDIVARLERYAPFATFGAPYAVVVSERLYWLAPGYVTAAAFPLAPSVAWQGETPRYVRAGFMGVVDAASGRTAAYVFDGADPLSAAWAHLAPEIIRPMGDLAPALREHVRYPEELFDAQLAAWHRLSAPAGLLTVRSTAQAADAAPSWWVGEGGSDTVVRLRRTAALEVGDPPVLAGVAEGFVRNGALALGIVTVDTVARVPGPTEMGQRFARLHDPAATTTGPIRVVPLGDAPIFLQVGYAIDPGGDASPQLRTVAIGWRGNVAAGGTVAEAWARLGSGVSQTGAGDSWAEARRWFQRLDAARRAGDWPAFGEAYEALRRLFGLRPDSGR
jgi:hypothetical protein